MGIRTSACTEAQLLETYVNSSYDVIKKCVDNLDSITQFANIDPESEAWQLVQDLVENVESLEEALTNIAVMETIAADIKKGNFYGSRKLDIDLALNKTGITASSTYDEALTIWLDTATTVYYSSATVLFVDGVTVIVPFVNDDGDPIVVSTHGAIIDQLDNNTTFTDKLENTSIFEDVGGKVGSILRITDITGSASNIDRITLAVDSGDSIATAPVYFYAKTTSSMQTLADRIGDVIAIGNNIIQLIDLSNNLTEFLALHANLTELLDIHTNMASILAAETHAANALIYKNDAASSASNAQSFSISASNSATSAANSVTQIQAITVDQTLTGLPGTNASVTYDGVTNSFDFSIPSGFKGDPGDPYPVDAQDLLANRSNYESFIDYPTNTVATAVGDSFLAIDTGEIYFVTSVGPVVWSSGYPFGKGVGIDNVAFLSTTDPSGNPAQTGATDTYRIVYTDATTHDFDIYNGADGGVASVNGYTGTVNLVEADIPDLDKYSQAEVNTLITATKEEAIAMSIVLGG